MLWCVDFFCRSFYSASLRFDDFFFLHTYALIMHRSREMVLFAPFCLCFAIFFLLLLLSFTVVCDAVMLSMWHISRIIISSISSFMCCFRKMNGIQYCNSRFFLSFFPDVLLLFGHYQKNGQIWLNKSQNRYWQRRLYNFHMYIQ